MKFCFQIGRMAALFEQFPHIPIVPIQGETTGQVIVAGADNVVFIQQLFLHKRPDIPENKENTMDNFLANRLKKPLVLCSYSTNTLNNN